VPGFRQAVDDTDDARHCLGPYWNGGGNREVYNCVDKTGRKRLASNSS
jgi:hypothetical protein